MANEIKLQKIALKASYKATLAPYARMDAVAMTMTSDFPDWQRSALSVDLWSHELRSMFQIQFNNCYFESDWPTDAQSAVQLGARSLDGALKKFEVNKLERLGMAHFFIVPKTESFQNLVFRCDKAFHKTFSSIQAFDDYELHDTAYIVIAKDKNSEWTYTVHIGPMTKGEFLSKYPLNLRLYDLERHSINHYRESIPEALVFIFIDAVRNDCDRHQAMANLSDVSKRSRKIADQLIPDFSGDKINGCN